MHFSNRMAFLLAAHEIQRFGWRARHYSQHGLRAQKAPKPIRRRRKLGESLPLPPGIQGAIRDTLNYQRPNLQISLGGATAVESLNECKVPLHFYCVHKSGSNWHSERGVLRRQAGWGLLLSTWIQSNELFQSYESRGVLGETIIHFLFRRTPSIKLYL